VGGPFFYLFAFILVEIVFFCMCHVADAMCSMPSGDQTWTVLPDGSLELWSTPYNQHASATLSTAPPPNVEQKDIMSGMSIAGMLLDRLECLTSNDALLRRDLIRLIAILQQALLMYPTAYTPQGLPHPLMSLVLWRILRYALRRV
jgi:hypothetical protein